MASKILYTSQCPSLDEWKKDSSVTFAKRKDDPILCRIDSLVDGMSKTSDHYAQLYIATDLFFTLDYWLKVYLHKPKMEKKREPAVTALYRYIVSILCAEAGVTVNVLPRELELMFGRELGDHGSKLDQEWDCANYLSREQADKWRLVFRNGKVYQFTWWNNGFLGNSKALALAESERCHTRVVSHPKAAGYAMSMGRDIYMAKHKTPDKIGDSSAHYHSSYMAGMAVMCAGEMLIEKGEIKLVNTSSGHYQPTDTHLLNVLQALQMHGIPLNGIQVRNYNGTLRTDAHQFLTYSGNWNKLLQQRQANCDHIQNRIQARIEDRQLFDWCMNYAQASSWNQVYDALVFYWGWNRTRAEERVKEVYERFHVPEQLAAERFKKFGPLVPKQLVDWCDKNRFQSWDEVYNQMKILWGYKRSDAEKKVKADFAAMQASAVKCPGWVWVSRTMGPP